MTTTEHETRHGSWWMTVPGLLTAFAAIITATGGLIAVLVQAGLVGSGSNTSNPSAERAPTTAQTTPSARTSERVTSSDQTTTVERSPVELDGLRGQSFKSIGITQTDGRVVSLRTFVVRGSASSFILRHGQQIQFDRIRSVEVVGADRLRFLLINGQQLEEDVEGVLYYVAGENDLGSYNSHINQISRIDFLR